MAQTLIYVTSNADQSGIVITDQTDWTALGVPRSTLSGISIALYGTTLVTPEASYVFSPTEESDYVTNGVVEIPFLSIIGLSFIADGWWNIKMSSNIGGYVSNYSGFGIYADITYAVFSQINSLHTPEEIKYNAEKFCTFAMFLKGLGYLDTTNVLSREVKFNKRLIALQKMTLNI